MVLLSYSDRFFYAFGGKNSIKKLSKYFKGQLIKHSISQSQFYACKRSKKKQMCKDPNPC